MRTFHKLALSIAGGSIVLGSVFCGISLLQIGVPRFGISRDFRYLDYSMDERYKEYKMEKTKIDPITDTIDIQMGFGDVEFIEADDYYIEYCAYGGEPELKMEDGSLAFTSQYALEQEHALINIDFGIQKEREVVKIYLPKNAHIKMLDIDSGSGDIKSDISDFTSEDAKIVCDFGNIELKDMKGKKLILEESSGDIGITNMEYDEAKCTNKFGEIELNDSVFKTSFFAELNSGSFTAKNFDSNRSEISSDFGDVILSGIGTLDSYNYELDTDFGEISINDKENGQHIEADRGEKELVIHVSSGSIEIEE